VKIRRTIWLTLCLAHLVLYTGCSAYTDFVVLNQSDSSVEIRYKVKKSTAGPLATSGKPSASEASNLRTYGGTEWQMLNPAQYQLIDDPEVDVVVVTLSPKQALRLTTMRSEGGVENCEGGPGFPVTDISISGANGKLELEGYRARNGFSKLSRALCVITYK
jgi:hypothetical protein